MTRSGIRGSASPKRTENAVSIQDMARDASNINIIRAARLLLDSEAEIIDDGAVAEVSGRILYAGSWSDLEQYLRTQGLSEVTEHVQNLGDVTLMPGWSHSPLHWGGSGQPVIMRSSPARDHLALLTRQCPLYPISFSAGLFDCHVHLVMDPDNTRTASDFLKIDEAAQLTLMASNALKLLDAGVTTARDLGCPKTLAVDLREQIASGKRKGPR